MVQPPPRWLLVNKRASSHRVPDFGSLLQVYPTIGNGNGDRRPWAAVIPIRLSSDPWGFLRESRLPFNVFTLHLPLTATTVDHNALQQLRIAPGTAKATVETTRKTAGTAENPARPQILLYDIQINMLPATKANIYI